MANDLSVTQVATIVNAIMDNVTGTVSEPGVIDMSKFVTVAQTALKTGFDPILSAISQVMADTIFSVRPYDRKFRSLGVTNQEYGNHTRKIQFSDQPAVDNPAYTLTDGESVDMYKVRKENVLQTNFYGIETFDYYQTFYRNQLKPAFNGPEELARYVAAKMLHIKNMREQRIESLSQMTVANMILAKSLGDSGNVLHLVTMYNAEKGTELTNETVHSPANWGDFARWAYAKINTIAGYLTRRTSLYHLNITGHTIMRQTPASYQKMYLISDFINSVDAEVRSMTFDNNYLKLVDTESVEWWQNPHEPYTVKGVATYTGVDGTVKTGTAGTGETLENVLGVLFDREAMGYSLFDSHVNVTPLNAGGDYYNQYWKEVFRYWNDITENAIVFVLD